MLLIILYVVIYKRETILACTVTKKNHIYLCIFMYFKREHIEIWKTDG